MTFLKKNIPIIIAAIVLLFAGCDELPCEYPDGVQMHAGFYSYDGTTLADTILETLILKLDNDNGTSYSDTFELGTQNIAFPLSMIADSSRIILAYTDSTADTIVFYYTQSLHLESHECGFANFYEISEIKNTTHELDSIRMPKDLVDYADEENIKIFY